jgi:hypothetical protein
MHDAERKTPLLLEAKDSDLIEDAVEVPEDELPADERVPDGIRTPDKRTDGEEPVSG